MPRGLEDIEGRPNPENCSCHCHEYMDKGGSCPCVATPEVGTPLTRAVEELKIQTKKDWIDLFTGYAKARGWSVNEETDEVLTLYHALGTDSLIREAHKLGTQEGRKEEVEAVNGLLRSMHEIGEREGTDTGWTHFMARLEKELDRQHQIMYPAHKQDGV